MKTWSRLHAFGREQAVCGDTALSSGDIIENICQKMSVLEITIDIFHTCFQNVLSFPSLNVTHLFATWGKQTIYSFNRHWYSLGVLSPSLLSQNGWILGLSMSSPLSRADLTDMTKFLACSLWACQGSKGISLLKNRHEPTLINRLYVFIPWRQQKFWHRVLWEQTLAEFPNTISGATRRCLRKWEFLELTPSWLFTDTWARARYTIHVGNI